MKTVHLDTGFLIRALVPGSREDRAIRNWLREGTMFTMSVVAWAEFLCGPLSPDEQSIARRLIGPLVPLEETDAAMAAALFNEGGRRRGSFVDCLLAATALGAGARFATSNAADFRRFVSAGLELAG